MPIAVQVISTGGLYGAERVLLELASYLAEHGWDSRVLAIDGVGAEPLVAAARARQLRAELLSSQRLSWWEQSRALARYLDGNRVDVVHSHGYKPDVFLAATGQPSRRACIATCHSWYSINLKLKLFEFIDKRALRRFAQVIAVSEEIERDLLNAGADRNRVCYIANGLDPTQPAPHARERIRRELQLTANEKLVLRVGRLASSKGNDVLLRAFASVQPRHAARLLFLGEGEELHRLQELARSLQIAARVTFLGFQDNVQDYLAATDLFVIPSLQEGLPMVLLEAMAAGRPIVSTAVGAIASVIDDGRTGRLIPPGKVEPLADALSDLLSNSEAASRYGTAAFSVFAGRFSRDAMGGRYHALYRQRLAERGG